MIITKNIFSTGVTIFKRDGKYYWTIKSEMFDTPLEALKDCMNAFDASENNVQRGV